MICIYILPVDSLKSSGFDEILQELPFGESEKLRLSEINSEIRKWESLGGLVALERLMRKFSPDALGEIARTENGKPYFIGASSLPFSISHSHGICAAAVASGNHKEIGLDVEVIDESYVRSGVAQRFFTAEERLRFELCDSSPESFFAIWTAKESQAKLDGGGLSSMLGAKESSGDEPIYVSQLTVECDKRRVMASICSHISNEAIRIYTDSELCK